MIIFSKIKSILKILETCDKHKYYLLNVLFMLQRQSLFCLERIIHDKNTQKVRQNSIIYKLEKRNVYCALMNSHSFIIE